MNYFEDIFTDYKEGNAHQRIELYMQHRELRSNFDQIENEESILKTEDSRQIVIEPSKINNRQPFFVRMKRWCFSIFYHKQKIKIEI